MAGISTVSPACAITGRPRPPGECPWQWSDQYDIKLQIAGYAFDASDRNTGNTFAVPFPYAAPGTVASFRNRSQDGFSGGGQIGYNWQFYNSLVAGLEADWTNESDSFSAQRFEHGRKFFRGQQRHRRWSAGCRLRAVEKSRRPHEGARKT